MLATGKNPPPDLANSVHNHADFPILQRHFLQIHFESLQYPDPFRLGQRGISLSGQSFRGVFLGLDFGVQDLLLCFLSEAEEIVWLFSISRLVFEKARWWWDFARSWDKAIGSEVSGSFQRSPTLSKSILPV